MYAVGEILEIIRPLHEERESQTRIAEILNAKGYRTKADREWTNDEVSAFARKRGLRWRRKYTKGGVRPKFPTVKASGGATWLEYVKEISISDLNSETKSYLIELLAKTNI